MIYNSVAEIFASLDETRRRLYARVENLTDAQQSFRRTSDAWTASEIIEHLSITERQLLQLFQMMLTKLEAAGAVRADGGANEDGGKLPAPVSIAELAAQAKGKKFEAPDQIRPSGRVPLATSLASLRETRAALQSLRPRLERLDGRAARYQHPVFGNLDLYQWLLFVGAHEDRHLRQIENIMQEEVTARQ